MGVTKDPRKEKITELKQSIKDATAELEQAREAFKAVNNENPQTDEERTDYNLRRANKLKELTDLSTVLHALGEELTITRMNKNMSTSFDWQPSPMNRRARRAMRRL